MHQPLRVVFDFSCPYCYLLWGYVQELRRTAPVHRHDAPGGGTRVACRIPCLGAAQQ